MSKSNAKEYLLEFKAKSSTPNWLGLLIQKAIDSNGQIPEADKGEIFNKLLEENELDCVLLHKPPDNVIVKNSTLSSHPSSEDQQKLIINKVTHIKGVNALIPNQSISFSPSLTVVYGLNGTGKSGYFRIIHELAGGIRQKNILSNIRSQNDVLEVDLDYSLNGIKQSTFKWQNRNERGKFPFNHVAVFDSEYLPILLNERESTVNIVPLGLHLFQIITSIIDDYKLQLEEQQHELEVSIPDLQPLIDSIHSANIKLLFQVNSLTSAKDTLLSGNNSMTVDDIAKLKELQQKRNDLEKNNIADSKKLLEQEKVEIELLVSHLDRVKKLLEETTPSASSAILNLSIKKKDREDKIQQFDILKNVPSQNSEEWQTFIESAEKYGVKIKQTTFDNKKTCIYCHQLLDDKALKLIQAYSKYLSDKSQEDFKSAVETINNIRKILENSTIDNNISENLTALLSGVKLDEQLNLNVGIDQAIKKAKAHRQALLDALNGKALISNTYSFDVSKIDIALLELVRSIKTRIDNFGLSEVKKQETIVKIKSQIEKLEDKQTLSKWKDKIESYFSIGSKVQKYKNVNSKIITTAITVLGSKAHDELLTESIRKSFEDELKALGKDVEVNLEKTGAGKGTVRTCIKILGSDVSDILSDGEQKASCLALFLGEAIQQTVNPIVFDDPVTSVDHEVAGLFAKRLLQISNERQVIVFTHNKLFYDSIFYWGNNLKDEQGSKTHHICRNYTQQGCSAKGCHVYTYTVDRESKDRVGKIFERQNESCQYFINKAEAELSNSFSTCTIAGYLKSAIEYYIDDKMLNNQGLLKDRKRKENIPWEKLDDIVVNKDTLSKLKIHWDNLSDRGTHLTENSTQNPLKLEDFKDIIRFLKE